LSFDANPFLERSVLFETACLLLVIIRLSPLQDEDEAELMNMLQKLHLSLKDVKLYP
jgi:hypothetical protein